MPGATECIRSVPETGLATAPVPRRPARAGVPA